MSETRSGSAATVFVRFAIEGWHSWPDAPDPRAYLRSQHRHLFHVEVRTEVMHDGREIEFHDLIVEAKAWLRMIGGIDGNFGLMSCESIARETADELAQRYARPFEVMVSEDGECGAVVRSEG